MRNCHEGCLCGKHYRYRADAPAVTNEYCYANARPLCEDDFRVLMLTFGFNNAIDMERFAIRQQLVADGVIFVSDEVVT